MRITIRNLSDLSQLDQGVLDAQFREELKSVIEDMRDRPSVSQARKITICLSLKPTSDGAGGLLEVGTEVEISSTFPKVRTREFAMGAIKTDALVYNDLSPDDPRQGTLDEVKSS